MVFENLPNNVSSGIPNVQNLTSEQIEYVRLYNLLTRTQSGVGTFGASPSSGLSYSTNDFPADVDVFDKGQEGLMNLFAKYTLVAYNLTGEKMQEIYDALFVAENTPELTNLASIFNSGEGTEGVYVVEDSFLTDEKYVGVSNINSIKNGNFETTADITPINSTQSVLNNIYSNFGNGVHALPYAKINTFVNVQRIGNLLFVYGKSRVTNAACLKITLYPIFPNTLPVTEVLSANIVNNPAENKWYEMYGIYQIQANAQSGDIQVFARHEYVDAGTANGKEMQTDGEAGVLVDDLTSTGLDTLLTSLGYTTDPQKEAVLLDMARQGYLDGLQSTGDKKYTSRGKNKAGQKLEQGNISGVSGNNLVQTNLVRSIGFEEVKPNTDYSFSCDIGSTVYRIYYYDSVGGFISAESVATSSTERNITTPINACQVRYVLAIFGSVVDPTIPSDIEFYQIEEGTVATTHEDYFSSSKYIPNLKAVISAGDVVELIDGEYMKIKRISDEFTFNGTEAFVGYVSGVGTNSDLSRMTLTAFGTDNKLKGDDGNPIVGSSLGYDGNAIYESVISTATAITFSMLPHEDLFIYIPTSELGSDDLTGFKNYLIASNLAAQFQLATPIHTKLNLSPLNVKTDGDIIVENEYPVLSDYSSGINVDKGASYNDIFIASASLVTPEGEIVLDPSDFVVVGSIVTNPNLSSTDIVWLGVGYTDGRTLPISQYTYAMNPKATDDALNQAVTTNSKTIEGLNSQVASNTKDMHANKIGIEMNVDEIQNNTVLANTKATTVDYTATVLSTGWAGGSAPFTKTLTVTGILASDTPIIDIVATGTYATDKTMGEDWSDVYRITTATNSITVYAHNIPSASIPVILKVVR
jgi:hypothetical protein